MSTPCSLSLRPNRLVVSEYEVPKVLVSRKWWVFIETPGRSMTVTSRLVYRDVICPGQTVL